MFFGQALEYLKAAMVQRITDYPVVHTYAPIPYLVDSTSPERVFVYQHGSMSGSPTPHRTAYPFYVSLQYITWGSEWTDQYEFTAQPDSNYHPVGNPWHEYLVELRTDESSIDPDWDVVFISSPSYNFEAGDRAYTELLEIVVNTCSP